MCTWDLLVDLCPPDSCVYAHLTFTDWHDQLVQDGVYWFLQDDLGGTVGSGVFQMDGVDRNAEDSVCIAPGTLRKGWQLVGADFLKVSLGIGISVVITLFVKASS